ncbi:MAG TPA: nuclear transport factor 2 family protein [Mycobacteriales bacterium]|nr:nuclear transport factor 2 family protein [Mycobacteriales bacterium]
MSFSGQDSAREAQIRAAAAAYGKAVDSGDDAALAAVHEPDAQIWHNTDGNSQTVEENLKLGAWLRRKMPDVAFTDVRVTVTEDGFVRRNVVTGTAPDGSRVRVPSCLVVEVSPAGKVAHVSEYLDSAGLAPLFAR